MIEEGAGADLAYVGGRGGDAADTAPPADARLRTLVEEEHLRTVDDVGLDAANVQCISDLRHAHHVAVRRPPYLPPSTVNSPSAPTMHKRKRESKTKGGRRGWF